MKFYVSSAFLQAGEIIEIARAADDLGYEGMAIPDHVVNLETLATPYPYTEDGERRWPPFTDWLDPWVLVGALAQVTSRLKFVTTVYIPAMRDPYSAAKAIGTAACLSGGRVELGIGVGWCTEEFDLLGQSFAKRGRRTDEMLELMKKLWELAHNTQEMCRFKREIIDNGSPRSSRSGPRVVAQNHRRWRKRIDVQNQRAHRRAYQVSRCSWQV